LRESFVARKQQKAGSASPRERYRELERESEEWSNRVEESVRKLDRVTKTPDPPPRKPTPA
jgi:hypothetical protein